MGEGGDGTAIAVAVAGRKGDAVADAVSVAVGVAGCSVAAAVGACRRGVPVDVGTTSIVEGGGEAASWRHPAGRISKSSARRIGKTGEVCILAVL